eukprot:Opistho-2@22320
MASQLARTVGRLDSMLGSGKLKTFARNLALGNAVKFAGTAGVDFVELKNDKVHVRIQNKKKVQNHIGSVHAAAMALLAETATGFVVGMNIPDNRLTVIKSMKVNYIKLAKGDMEAVSHLTPEHLEFIRTNEKGELLVPVKVTDSTGNEPVTCEMVWAWLPKVKKTPAPADAKAKAKL